MVVGDDHLCLGSFVAHPIDPALVVVVATVGVQAVIREADQTRPQIRPEYERQLIDIASGGLIQPGTDSTELCVDLVIERNILLLFTLPFNFQRADVVGTALDNDSRNRLAQHLAEEGNLFMKELALQRLVGR